MLRKFRTLFSGKSPKPRKNFHRDAWRAVEALESRVLLSALDLTTTGASGTLNGGFFEQIDPSSTGTGVINSFLRIQASGTEQGYNTDGSPFQFDEKAGNFTHSVQLGEVPVVDVGGTNYRQFLLDINETLPGQDISLVELQIFVQSNGNPANGAYTNAQFGGSDGTTIVSWNGGSIAANLVYDLDGGAVDGDSQIDLNYALNHGSGSGDMFAHIPESLFAGLSDKQYVYLYSKFSGSDAGFEEWAVLGREMTGGTKFDITGQKFEDLNGDGDVTGDPGENGWTINLYRETDGVAGLTAGDTLEASTVTATVNGVDGVYSFTKIDPYIGGVVQTFYVAEAMQGGWTQTFGGNLDNEYYTFLLNNDVSFLDFGNFDLVDLSGVKFRDNNFNSTNDPGEELIGGFTINLYVESNGTAGLQTGLGGDTPAGTTTTADVTGAYSFIDLGVGTYYVEEVVPDNWIQTAPLAGTYTVVVDTSGENQPGLDFGNVEIGAGGGHTKGYWQNTNGEATIAALGGWDAVKGTLANLYLRNADGSLFDVANRTYEEFADWLTSAETSATNMAGQLSAQAAAMQLNLLAGDAGLSDPDGVAFPPPGDRLIYAPGVTGANAFGFVSIQAVLDQARAILHGGTTLADPPEEYVILLDGHPDRPYATLLKDALDDANNNRNFLVIP